MSDTEGFDEGVFCAQTGDIQLAHAASTMHVIRNMFSPNLIDKVSPLPLQGTNRANVPNRPGD